MHRRTTNRPTNLSALILLCTATVLGCDPSAGERQGGPINRDSTVCEPGFENVPTVDDCYQDIGCYEAQDGTWCTGQCPPAFELQIEDGIAECVDAPPCIDGFELVPSEEECLADAVCYPLLPLGWCTGSCPAGYEYQDFFGQPGCVPSDECVADEHTLCLVENRYSITVDWATSGGEVGGASVVDGFQHDQAGLFTFFSPNNIEMLIKVLPACEINDRTWVFAAAVTDVAYTISVLDTYTGDRKTYSKNNFDPAPAITDTDAFANCGN